MSKRYTRFLVRGLAVAGTIVPIALLAAMMWVDDVIAGAELHGSIGALGLPVLFVLALASPILIGYALSRRRELAQWELAAACLPALTCAAILAWTFVLPALRA